MPLPEFKDIGFTVDGHIATIEIQRPPHNYLDIALIDSIASALEYTDRETEVRAVMLCSDGRSFCVSADLARRGT